MTTDNVPQHVLDLWEEAKAAVLRADLRAVGRFVLNTDLDPRLRYQCPACGAGRGFTLKSRTATNPGFYCFVCLGNWDAIDLAKAFLGGVSTYPEALRALVARFAPHIDLGEPPGFERRKDPLPVSYASGGGGKAGTDDWVRLPGGWKGPPGAVVTAYDYADADGTLLHQVGRLELYDTTTGERTFKTFRPRWRAAESDPWQYRLKGCPPWPLYNAEAVAEAVALGRVVFFVEGEADADALTERGLTATTINGAGWDGLETHHVDALAGAYLCVCADMDAAGQEKARTIVDALRDAAAGIAVISAWPGFAEGSSADISDWLNAGGDVHALLNAVELHHRQEVGT